MERGEGLGRTEGIEFESKKDVEVEVGKLKKRERRQVRAIYMERY